MLKPICVSCERFMRPKKNAVRFVEGMRTTALDTKPMAGRYSLGWDPYKVWCGDLWMCPDCGHEAIYGVGTRPLSENYKEDFEEHLLCCSGLLVKDC